MGDDSSLTRMRQRLAARVITGSKISSDRVAAALRDVPRHLFLPHLPPESAYRDDAIVTKRDADGQAISSSSQPAIMAIMLDQLDLSPGQRVLEIGAGTGYNAALMSHIVGPSGTVVSVDIDSDVAGQARDHLASAGYHDVTVVGADGAAGYPAGAPYDRVIATVGVSDLAPAWLDQAAPGARIVVPLDVRGRQLAVAFERTGTDGAWTSVSLAPCGFMRMRGSLAGPDRMLILASGLAALLPDGLLLADGREADPEALAGFYLAGPSADLPTGVSATSSQVIWGLSLWLAIGDVRSFTLVDERPGGTPRGGRGARRNADWLRRAAADGRRPRLPAGILDSGGIALLTAAPAPDPPADGSPAAVMLEVAGFGPHGAGLAADLAAHVVAWDQAGRPGVTGLQVDAYPRSSAAEPEQETGTLLIERPGTRFAVYRRSI